jgi:hypothetical protein
MERISVSSRADLAACIVRFGVVETWQGNLWGRSDRNWPADILLVVNGLTVYGRPDHSVQSADVWTTNAKSPAPALSACIDRLLDEGTAFITAVGQVVPVRMRWTLQP